MGTPVFPNWVILAVPIVLTTVVLSFLGASRSTRLVGGGLVMLLLTLASTLYLVRSGALLSDMRFEILAN